MRPIYSVVIPAYNEEDVLEESYRRLKKTADTFDGAYELIFGQRRQQGPNDGIAGQTCNVGQNRESDSFLAELRPPDCCFGGDGLRAG